MRHALKISRPHEDSSEDLNPYAVSPSVIDDEPLNQRGLSRAGAALVAWCRKKLGLESLQDVDQSRLTNAFLRYFEVRPTNSFIVKVIQDPCALVEGVPEQLALVNETLPLELTAKTCRRICGSLLVFDSPETAFTQPADPLKKCSFLIVPKRQSAILRSCAAAVYPADICKKIVSMDSFARALDTLSAQHQVFDTSQQNG